MFIKIIFQLSVYSIYINTKHKAFYSDWKCTEITKTVGDFVLNKTKGYEIVTSKLA